MPAQQASDDRPSFPAVRVGPGDGGNGYSGFGHPTEVQDAYREAGLDHTTGNQPPLPQPLNPPLPFPVPPSTSGDRLKCLWEWREFQLVASPSADQTFRASSVPKRWIVSVDATAGTRIAVYLGENSGGVTPFRLGVGGHLTLPGTGAVLTIKNLSASTGFVTVMALGDDWDFVDINYGS